MFRPNLNFFEDKKTLKKLKNQIKQDQIEYELKQSSRTSHNLNACPLTLRPTKLSDTALNFKQNGNVEPKKKRQKHKRSKNGYEESNSTKADIDESILTGLQTVIDLCGLLEKCEQKRKQKQREYKNTGHTGNKEFNNACHTDDFDTNPKKNILHDESIYIPKVSRVPDTANVCKLSHENHSTINQRLSETTITHSPSVQKIPPNRSPDNQSLQILTSSAKKSMHSKENIDEPQVVQGGDQNVCHVNYQVQQAKIINQLSVKQEPSASIRDQTRSTEHVHPESKKSHSTLRQRSQDEDIHQYWNRRNGNARLENPSHAHKTASLQSLTDERPDHSTSSTRHSSQTCTNYPSHPAEVHNSKQLSTKCFPPMEIIPEPKYATSEHASVYDPATLCNPQYTNPIYKTQIDCKKSRHGIPLVQPVIGCCKSGKCGDPQMLKSTKYALVRICEFIGFNIYEIMKPYKDKPRNIPTCIAEIFVTLQKEDHYFISQKSTRISFQIPDKSRKSITKLHSVPYSPTLPIETPIKEQPIRKTKSKCCAKRKTSRPASIQLNQNSL